MSGLSATQSVVWVTVARAQHPHLHSIRLPTNIPHVCPSLSSVLITMRLHLHTFPQGDILVSIPGQQNLGSSLKTQLKCHLLLYVEGINFSIPGVPMRPSAHLFTVFNHCSLLHCSDDPLWVPQSPHGQCHVLIHSDPSIQLKSSTYQVSGNVEYPQGR